MLTTTNKQLKFEHLEHEFTDDRIQFAYRHQRSNAITVELDTDASSINLDIEDVRALAEFYELI